MEPDVADPIAPDPLAPTPDELRQVLMAEKEQLAATARRMQLQVDAIGRDLSAVRGRYSGVVTILATLGTAT